MTIGPQRDFAIFSALAIALVTVIVCQVKPLILGDKPADKDNWTSQAQTSNNLDDRDALSAQADHAIKREITVEARVKKLLPTDNQGLPHQKFLIELSNGSTILIAHDLKMAPAVPIQPGDVLRIRGEYIWNSRGGLVHWTHHSDTPRHEDGWIEYKGSRYQ